VLTCSRCGAAVVANQRFCGQCGAAQSPDDDRVAVDHTLDGKYRLTYLIGQGGMGAVYRAEVVGLGQVVAVKILHPVLAADAQARRRLENEARLASQINHPNIVSILDFQSSPSLTYLVMEYLMGLSLREVLSQVGFLGVQRAIHITRQLLSALEASHTLNVLHRDLKPDNIYLIARQDSLDFVKVLDFGMAVHEHGVQQDRITSIGQVCGTPAYMSPEQARGKELTVRSDLYSVGVILYECLTGVNPFLGANTADTLVNHLTKTPELPSKACKSAGIPPYLDALVMQALRKTPTERFESAGQFRKVLEALVLARRPEAEGAPALTTCPECGKPLIVGALRCESCKHVLQKPLLGPESIKEILPEAMMQALEATGPQVPKIELSATITSTTCPAVSWDPPLTGRQEELALIERFLAGISVGPGAQHILRLIGGGGSGKGRLAREAQQRAERAGWRCLWAEPEFHNFAPLHPIQRVATRLLGIPEGLPDEADLTSALEGLHVDGVHAQGLFELFGLGGPARDPADVRRARRAEAWRAVVCGAATRAPTLLIFNDLRFMDAPSRELVASLAALEVTANPVRVIVTQDPELLMLWPETPTLNVPPLSRDDATALAGLLLEYAAVGNVSPEQVAEVSKGSPLLLLELVRLLALDPLSGMPKSLGDVISRRIGQLPPKARIVLHAMAVLGRPTSPDTLTSMVASKLPETAALNLLSEQGFLSVGDRGWRPAHRAYREIAYASIPIAVRSVLHLEAARLAVQGHMPPATIAHHLFEGGNHAGAVPYLLRAGLSALDALDDALASEHFNRVLRVIPAPPKHFDGSTKAWLTATLGLSASLSDGGDLASALHVLKGAAHAASEAGWSDEKLRIERRRERLRKRLLAGIGPGATGFNLEELRAIALAEEDS
jgi:serine/threonine protein kinase